VTLTIKMVMCAALLKDGVEKRLPTVPVMVALTIPLNQCPDHCLNQVVHVQPVTHMFIMMEIIVALVIRRKSTLLKVKGAMVGQYHSPVAAARMINMFPALQISAVITTKPPAV